MAPQKRRRAFGEDDLPRCPKTKRLLRTVGACGLPAGGVAYDPATGLAVRVEAGVTPLIHRELVETATALLEKGEVHAATAALRHDDASTTERLVKEWTKRFDEPSTFDRVHLEVGSALTVPFAVERVGELPLDCAGRRFVDGDDFFDETEVKATYALHVADEGRWLTKGDLARLLKARADTLKPIATLRVTTANLDVDFFPNDGKGPCDERDDACDERDDFLYRILEQAASDTSLDAAASMVVALPKAVVVASSGSEGKKQHHRAAAAAAEDNNRGDSLDAAADMETSEEEEQKAQEEPGAETRSVFGSVLSSSKKSRAATSATVPVEASKLAKALCRGRPLCATAGVVRKSFRRLATSESRDARSGDSGIAAALRVIVSTGLAASSPWLDCRGRTLSLGAVVALFLAASADDTLRFSDDVVDRVETTLLALWARDLPKALWPWRGWRNKETTDHRGFECVDDNAARSRDALRALLLVNPPSREAKVVINRLLGHLKTMDEKDETACLPLVEVEDAVKEEEEEEEEQLLLLDAEALYAAFDHSLRPSFLILLQATLPFAPRVEEQHSLRALAELVHRLSSGVNARAVRQCLGGTADTSRFTSFLDTKPPIDGAGSPPGDSSSSSLSAREEPSAESSSFPVWTSTKEAVKLTATERVLYDIVLALQAELATTLDASGDLFSSDDKASHTAEHDAAATKMADDVAAMDDDVSSFKSSTIKRTPGQHSPPPRSATPYERRAAFLALLGERRAVEVGEASYAAMVIGDEETPVVVQALDHGERQRKTYLDPTTEQYEAAREAFLELFAKNNNAAEVAVPKAPPGLEWIGLPEVGDVVRVRVVARRDKLRFFVGDVELPPFDAGPVLAPCGGAAALGGDKTVVENEVPPALGRLLRRALYLGGGEDDSNDRDVVVEPVVVGDLAVLKALDLVACRRRRAAKTDEASRERGCYDWFAVAEEAPLSRNVWRDAVVKLHMRSDADVVEIAICARDGSRGGRVAVQQLTEGPVLRLFYVLAALYPEAVVRVDELRFKIHDAGHQFAHLSRTLSTLAFGSFDDGSIFSPPQQREEEEAGGGGPRSTRRPRRVASAGLRIRPRSAGTSPPALALAAADSDEGESDDELPATTTTTTTTTTSPSSRQKKKASPLTRTTTRKRPSLNLGALPDLGHGTLYGATWGVASKTTRGTTTTTTTQKEAAPRISTTLWRHQAEARDKVLEGIRSGKRGFADASTVGAGKTLTALACVAAANALLRETAVERRGALVLCPTNALIAEWVQQAMLHTSGFEVVVQRQNGALTSKGSSGPPSSKSTKKRTVVELGPRSLVITTLARHREHPFTQQPGWDLVVIDECLSVQSDSAMQAAEAWRSVVASRCGCLLLSATLFRSSYAKLFYMIRMLRSPLPRTPSYLPALLKEHVCCFVPSSRRSWKLAFEKIPLPSKVEKAYKSRVDAFAASRKSSSSSSSSSPRDLYVTLKKFLREHFEPETLIDAVVDRVKKLRRRGRRVLVFANTERELERILTKLPDAVTLADVRRRQATRARPDFDLEHDVDDTQGRPLALTVADGSHGLNLQDRADSVVCRPQPGDVLEQMKGRVDRPGQSRQNLELVVVVAEGTVEEAEAANVRLCGQFFRQYLDPLAKTFQERAVEAVLASSAEKSTSVAQAFAKTLAAALDGTSAVVKSPQNHQQRDDDDVVMLSEEQQEDGEASSSAGEPTTSAETVAATPTRKRRSSPTTFSTGSTVAASASRKRSSAARDSTPPTATPPSLSPSKKKKKEKAPFRVFPSAAAPAPRLTASSMEGAIAHLSRADPKLAALVAQIGPPTSMLETIPAVNLETNPYPPVSWRSLCKSIVYQQISVTAAKAILGRLIEVCGGDDDFTPHSVIAVDEAKLLSKKTPGGFVGLSRTKAHYVRNLSRLYAEGTLSDAIFASLDDDAVVKTLRQVDGIGEWSCHMFCMFALGRPDILPVGDLAIQKGFKKLYATNQAQTGATAVNELPTRADMERIAEPWKPWRTIGSFYMWHVVETSAANWV